MEALTTRQPFEGRERRRRGTSHSFRREAVNEQGLVPRHDAPSRPLLDKLKIYFELVNCAIATIAIVVCGIWTYDHYVMAQEDDWSVAIDLKTEVVSTDDDQVALRIKTTFTNTGKVPATADEKGCTLTVREHPCNKSSPRAESGIVPWKGDDDEEPIVDHLNLLARYIDSGIDAPSRLFFLNPGESRQETQIVPVSKGKFYGIAVRFWGVNQHDGLKKRTLRSTASNDFV